MHASDPAVQLNDQAIEFAGQASFQSFSQSAGQFVDYVAEQR